MSNEKYAENQISNSTSHQKKKKTEMREEQKHVQLQIHQFVVGRLLKLTVLYIRIDESVWHRNRY